MALKRRLRPRSLIEGVVRPVQASLQRQRCCFEKWHHHLGSKPRCRHRAPNASADPNTILWRDLQSAWWGSLLREGCIALRCCEDATRCSAASPPQTPTARRKLFSWKGICNPRGPSPSVGHSESRPRPGKSTYPNRRGSRPLHLTPPLPRKMLIRNFLGSNLGKRTLEIDPPRYLSQLSCADGL